MTWDELQRFGPPIRLRDLRSLTGYSKMKFLDDIDRGRLNATKVPTGQTSLWIVERIEARRYLASIGFVPRAA